MLLFFSFNDVFKKTILTFMSENCKQLNMVEYFRVVFRRPTTKKDNKSQHSLLKNVFGQASELRLNSTPDNIIITEG